VKLVIMPQSQDPQPQPSFELRRQVQQFLAARIPAARSPIKSQLWTQLFANRREAIVVRCAAGAGLVSDRVGRL
jgi:hypothetical protein